MNSSTDTAWIRRKLQLPAFMSVVSTAVALLGMPQYLAAQDNDEDPGTSADDIAKALANPNATLGFMTLTFDTIAYKGDIPGAGDEQAWKIGFQPSLPYPISDSVNLFVRPLIPVLIDQPFPIIDDQPVTPADVSALNFDSQGIELGDISFDAALGKTLSNGTVLFGGLVATLPTATDDAVGLDQYLLGPEFYIGKVADWGAVGVLLTHQWDIAGEDSFDTSVTGGQYFFTYNLKNAWQIQMTPTFSYNHEAEDGNEFSFPIGVGISKTIVWNKTPLKFNLQYWDYVESPDAFGNDWQIRLNITPVVPLPW